MKKFKDSKGRTRIEVKNGEAPPRMITVNGITAQELGEVFEAKFDSNFTDALVLDTIADKLDENSIIAGEARLAYSAYESLKRVNDIVEKIDMDVTKTVGAKILLKHKLTKQHFDNFEGMLNTLDLDLRVSVDEDAKQLFSNNLELNSVEQTLLPAYIEKAKDVDISVFAGSGTPSESRIVLNIMRDFPHLAETHSTFEEATFFANYEHTKEVALGLEAKLELQDHIKTMTTKYREAKNKFLNPEVLDLLQKSKIEV